MKVEVDRKLLEEALHILEECQIRDEVQFGPVYGIYVREKKRIEKNLRKALAH